MYLLNTNTYRLCEIHTYVCITIHKKGLVVYTNYEIPDSPEVFLLIIGSRPMNTELGRLCWRA